MAQGLENETPPLNFRDIPKQHGGIMEYWGQDLSPRPKYLVNILTTPNICWRGIHKEKLYKNE
jgi:hypothetical protein